jgi:4'-phosphopantetheinyl transferase EntD
MGGWVAWNLGKDLGIPVLLLNPAVHSRSIDIDIEPVRESKASKVFLAIGLADDIIDPDTTIDWLNKHDKLDWNMNNTYKAIYGHRTSVERFIDIWVHFEKNIEAANELQKRYAL